MRTVKEVSDLTGVSVRTLQYYDEIGILKPTKVSHIGYRFYDDSALEKLQQILFFKELDFSLKDIKTIMESTDYDRQEILKKQKKLLTVKRDRLNGLLKLIERIEKGDVVMSFKEFDMSEYIEALEQFKIKNTDDVLRYWGSEENFNCFIQKIKDDEIKVAKLAIQEYGSVEKYTKAMKYNLEHFAEIMEKQRMGDVEKIVQESDNLYSRLTSDLSKDFSSDEIQSIVREIEDFMQENAGNISLGVPYWNVVIDSYSNDYVRKIADSKYGVGASDYIVKSFQYYVSKTRNRIYGND